MQAFKTNIRNVIETSQRSTLNLPPGSVVWGSEEEGLKAEEYGFPWSFGLK